MEARYELGATEAIHACPEGASTYACYKKAIDQGLITREENVVIFNCGNGLKYEMEDNAKSIDRHAPIDFGPLLK